MIINYFQSVFWATAVSLVGLIVPILALFLIFRLLHDILWK